MSRTSTDARRWSDARFRRALAFTIATLGGLCLVFLGLGYFQGPKLSSAQLDTAGVRLFVNQPIAQVSPEQVTIEPTTPFTVTNGDGLVALQFKQSLLYGTDYRVRIDGVANATGGPASSIEYRFTTTSPQLYFLDRGEPEDSIVRTGLSGASREIVYSGRHIQDFAAIDRNTLAVVTLTDENTSSLDLVSLRDGVSEKLLLPDVGSIAKLDVSTPGSVLGFTLSSAKAGVGQLNSRTLYTVDLDAGRAVQPVLDLDGEPMRVLGWQFVPGSSLIAALNLDRSVLVVDPASGTATPLGQLQELHRVSPDGTIITGSDPFGPVAVTIANGEQTRLKASPLDGRTPFLGETEVLPNGDRIANAVLPNATNTQYASLLLYDDGTTSRVLYRTIDDAGSIQDFSVSPNSQYVAIETVPNSAASVSDGYFYDARSTSTTTVIVDVATGSIVRSFEGFDLAW
ncbi:MAG: hypothetical protein JWP85_2588 [Rhodoglobus sp.]|nr:hypothetical protein [Rhodoglobus sp.]